MPNDHPLPTALFHYTSSHGAFGILKSHEFWLTNFESLNDSSEILYGLTRISQRIIEVTEHEADESVRGRLRGFAEALNSPMKVFELSPEHNMATSVAVCSFSELGDDLSQWRAYGTSTGGFSINVRPEDLRILAETQGFSLEKCLYDDEDVVAAVDAMLARVNYQIRDGSYLNLWAVCVEVAARIKHPAFKPECEWRLVRSNLPFVAMQTEHINGRLRAIVKLNWATHRNIVQGLIIGPHPNAELTARAIGPLLDHAIGSSTMFTVSRIPYRGS